MCRKFNDIVITQHKCKNNLKKKNYKKNARGATSHWENDMENFIAWAQKIFGFYVLMLNDMWTLK